MIAACLALLGALASWLMIEGKAESPVEQAPSAGHRSFAGLATALGSGQDFEQLARDHSTPGGINELFLTILNEAGVFENVGLRLQHVLDTLSVRSLETLDHKITSK